MNPQPTPIEYLELQIEEEFNPDLSPVDRDYEAFMAGHEENLLALVDGILNVLTPGAMRSQLRIASRIIWANATEAAQARQRKIEIGKSDKPNYLAKQAN